MRGLIKADGAADFASVEKGCDFSVGLLIEPETDFDPTFVGLIAVQFTVVNVLHGDGNLAVNKGDFRGGRQRARAFLVYETGGDHHNEDERAHVNRGHPETLAPGGPESFTARRARCRHLDRLAALHFEQHHQRG